MRTDSRSQAYCERDGNKIDPWGEPLNVVSNGPQLVLGLWYMVKVHRDANIDVQLPGAMLYTATAMGSTIWHAVGITATYYFDIALPVAFIGWFTFNYAYRVLGVRSVALRFAATFGSYGGLGVLAYIHDSNLLGVHWAWIALLLPLAVVHKLKCTWKPNALLKSWLVMCVALFWYAADRAFCKDEQPGYQPGYHWLWHLFSAIGGFLILHSLPPEDWAKPGHAIDDPWCGGLRRDAVGRSVHPATSSKDVPPRGDDNVEVVVHDATSNKE